MTRKRRARLAVGRHAARDGRAARRLQRKARPGTHARAVRWQPVARAAALRRPAARGALGSTTTSGSSGTACWRPGRCRRACRSSRARSISPSTSRTTRSTMRVSRARSRKGATAPARSRSGIAARTSSWRTSPTAGLTVRLQRRAAAWDVDARSGEARRRGAELAAPPQARRRRGAARRPELRSRCSRPSPSACRRERAGRSSRSGTATARSPTFAAARRRCASRNGNDLTDRFAAVAKELAKAVRTPDCVARRRGLRARRARPPELLGDAAGRRSARLRACSTCSRPTASRSSRCRSASGAQRLAALRRAGRCVQLSGAFDDGEALLEAADRAGARRRDREARRLPLPGGQAQPRLAEGEDARPPGARDLRLDEGPGPPRGALRRARARRLSRRRAAVGRELRHRLHASATSTSCARACSRSGASDAPFASVPKMPRVRRGDVVWVEPALVCEVEFAEWTHDGHLRSPTYLGLRDDKPAREVRPRGPRAPVEGDVEPARVKLSNLDKLFWPEETSGVTKGDLVDYYRDGRRRARAAPARPAVHDAPLPRRRVREGVLPEGRARRTCRTGSRRFQVDVSTRDGVAAAADDLGAARERRRRRSSGWRTWAAST